jgi:hypothetical protein
MNGVRLSPDTARRMKAFFDRHEVDKKGSTWDEQGKGWQAWNGWGGDAGYAWARKVVKQMEARDKKELAEPASCPVATQDIKTNLANRQTAVDDANYGPANPNELNEDYWKAKANEFQGDVATAKKMLCGNCAAFDQRGKVLGCIKKGIGEDANEVAIGGDLGYCEIFDFKCAAKRTCDAWIVGGPITDKKQLTKFDCGTGAGGFKEGNTCAVGGNEESSSTKASTKSPELMTPEEFRRSAKIGKLQKATGKIVPGEEKAKTPLQIGELNKYSPKDIAHFYAKRDSYSKDKITDEGIKIGQARLIADAISLKRSINAKSVDQLKIKLPKSYILKDDKYIYKGN